MLKTARTIALVEPAAGNIDAVTQKFVLRRYAEKHNINIDLMIGEQAPQSGTAGEPEHRNLLNLVREGSVGRVLVLKDVRSMVPESLVGECQKAGVELKFIDVQQEGHLT